MTYLNPHLRLVLIGTMGPVEEFSYGLNLIGPPNAPRPQDVPPAVIAACTTFFQNTTSTGVFLTTIKLNEIGEDGKYTQDTTVQYDYPNAGIPGSGANRYPHHVALAVSLGTTRQRGLATKGRFYIPAPQADLELPNQTILGTAQIGIATRARDFVNALNVAMDPWTVGLTSNVRSGGESIVTRVRVGKVLDTMRSRRTSLDEAYTEFAVAPVH